MKVYTLEELYEIWLSCPTDPILFLKKRRRNEQPVSLWTWAFTAAM